MDRIFYLIKIIILFSFFGGFYWLYRFNSDFIYSWSWVGVSPSDDPDRFAALIIIGLIATLVYIFIVVPLVIVLAWLFMLMEKAKGGKE